MATIGVLAVQGDFAEHMHALRDLGADSREVRLPQDLGGLSGLILPGGESTAFSRLMGEYALVPPIKTLAQSGMPLWGTCAGLIALACRVRGDNPSILGLMDITVDRNAYGRQVDSFETDVPVPAIGEQAFHAVFIRAPKVVATGPQVETLACLPDGTPVAVRQANLLGTSFHPELTRDLRFHAYFLRLVKEWQASGNVAAI